MTMTRRAAQAMALALPAIVGAQTSVALKIDMVTTLATPDRYIGEDICDGSCLALRMASWAAYRCRSWLKMMRFYASFPMVLAASIALHGPART
jgi:hypothetical protein